MQISLKAGRRGGDIENLGDSLTAQEETKAVLSDVMRPERFRVPIMLYYYLGFLTSEIFAELHASRDVRTRFGLGASKLKFIPRVRATVKSNQIARPRVRPVYSHRLTVCSYAAVGEPLRRKGHAKPYVAAHRMPCRSAGDRRGRLRRRQFQLFCLCLCPPATGIPITRTNGGSSGTKYTYKRVLAMASRPKSLEGAVQEVNLSVEGNGYTLDIHEMAIDQNGCGAVTFTLSNPKWS